MSRLTLSASVLVALVAVAVGVFITRPLQTEAATPPSEWPQHRADAGRTGFVDDVFDEDLSLRWVYQAPQPPCPASVSYTHLRAHET